MRKITLFFFVSALLLMPAWAYSGEIECSAGDCLNGRGTKTFPNGSEYVGDFKDGKYHGQGIFVFANGSKYEGEFKYGKYDGQGTYSFANGSMYSAHS